MALTTQQITNLNQMCPSAKGIGLGSALDMMAPFNEVSSAPSASAANVGKMFFDSTNKKLYFCVDATTMKEIAFV